jgi:hypothetical protein
LRENQVKGSRSLPEDYYLDELMKEHSRWFHAAVSEFSVLALAIPFFQPCDSLGKVAEQELRAT